MTPTRLKLLRIECFRGSTQQFEISFDDKPLVVIFGENGTGKSTLVDSFDLIANGKIGSLEDRSSATNKHAPAIGRKPTDVKITLVRGNEQWDGTLKGIKPQVTLDSPSPVIDILRRSQLLRLVEAQPAKRYEALQGFIDVGGVEASENELDRAVKSVNQEIVSANRRQLEAETQLKELWESNGKPLSAWKEWAISKSGLSTNTLDQSISELTGLVAACDTYSSRRRDYDTAEQRLQSARQALESVVAEKEGLEANWKENTPQIIQTLTATSLLLNAGWDEEACPVCQQPIPPAELRKRVADALEAIKSLKALHDREVESKRGVTSAREFLDNEHTKLVNAIRTLLNNFKPTISAQIENFDIDLNSLESIADSKTPDLEKSQLLLINCEKLVANREQIFARKESFQRDKNQLHTVQTATKVYDESVQDSKLAFAIHQQLQAALMLVRDQRIQFIQSILNSVSLEADRLYSIIHPKEDTKSGRLELDPEKRASLLQYVEFAGHKKVEPQGYFSDSHLDTLGFCYWLALAKRKAPAEKFVVLDDVFTSVDSAHLGQIIELIDTECDQFAQFFIFTHNRNWRDRYKYNQAAANKSHLIELHKWTPLKGISHSRTTLELVKLVELLAKFSSGDPNVDRQELASKCGILLEAILSHLSQHYQCKVPHRTDGEYTLGDLISGCQNIMKVLQVQRASDTDLGQPEPVKEAFRKLCDLAFIRNQVGCHFNFSGSQIADSDIEQFGNATVVFSRLVVCEHCGEVPRSDKSTHRQCSCKKTRLIPAKL